MVKTTLTATITVHLHGLDPKTQTPYPGMHREFLRITEGDTPIEDINVSLFDARIYYAFDKDRDFVATIDVGDAIEQFVQMYPYLIEAAKKEISHESPRQSTKDTRPTSPREGTARESSGTTDPTPEGWPKETL